MKLKTNTMYILSAPPGAGKSTLLKRLLKEKIISKEMIISTDKLRQKILGNVTEMTNGSVLEDYSSESDGAVFQIMEKIVEEKAKEGLTMFIDATNVTESDRLRWCKLAKKHNLNHEILIFDEDIEVCKERNSKRNRILSDEVIERFYSKFERKSLLPYKIINADTEFSFEPLNVIKSDDIDFIGDIHGLYDELILLIEKLGYKLTDNKLTHPENRKIVFLGDLIDRGEDSIKVLDLVYNAVKFNGHYCIQGNHEIKLINNWTHFNEGKEPAGSPAVIKTFLDFLLECKDKEEKINFLKNLPAYYVIESSFGKIACVHANIIKFNPLKTLKSDMLYGNCRKYFKKEDTDAGYQKLYDKGINEYTLIRGHIESTSKQPNIISLEKQGSFGGKLVGMKLSDVKNRKFIEVKSNFDYKEYKKETKIQKHMRDLIEEGLVKFQSDETNLLKIYKYSKKVFFDNLWNKHPALLKSRGLVLDISGNIIQHPFTKVFNYSENDAGLDIKDSTVVQAVEKLNGFLGCITKHPFKDDLLVTTTGSFDSDFVGYIKDFITPKIKGKLLNYFKDNDKTLMFEVIHPEDPHIIKYKESEQGLYLIGARGKNETDIESSEKMLDKIAEMLDFKRAKYFNIEFGKLKELVKTSKLEGYMVRDIKTNVILLKFKTPFYLTTKFIGRMGKNKIKFMYANKNKFKETVDEEFYPIVDQLVTTVSEEIYINLSNEEKVVIVREAIEKLR